MIERTNRILVPKHLSKPASGHRYDQPHDTGPRGHAAARRLRQIRAGALKGLAVSEAARYAAHGLLHPSAR